MNKRLFLVIVLLFSFALIAVDLKFQIFQKPVSSKKFLGIPFVAQVNQGNEILDRIGCEEAAIVMAVRKISPEKVTNPKTEMEKIIRYQEVQLGGHRQIGPETIAAIIKKLYDLDGKVVKVKNPEQLKEYIENNSIVIVPAIAKELGNPYYREQGYHMYVLNGFNESGFFAHDPGTNSGNNYFYLNEKVFNSIKNIENDEKEVLVLKGVK